jgi:hypothetical protein
MKLLSKQGSSWDKLTMVVHLAATHPVTNSRRISFSGDESGLSRLTMARKKSLTLQEMMSPHWINRRKFSEPCDVDPYASSTDGDGNDSGFGSDDEENEFSERRAVGDDRVIFNPVTLQAFDSITNQEYNSLAPLLQDTVHYDILGSIELPVIRDTISEFEFDSTDDGKNKSIESLMKPLTTLSLVLAEVISTEAKFVADIWTLNSLLTELRYSTLVSVKSFVDSKFYTGISTATETLKITHSQFLKAMQSFHPQSPPNNNGNDNGNIEEDFATLFSNTMDQCQVIFDAFTRFTPFFSLFSQFIVNHDGLSLLFQSFSSQDEQFKIFLTSCERNVNEQLMSLIIKPVQRLPRYVLLTKEIQLRLNKFKIIHEKVRQSEEVRASGREIVCGNRYVKICGLEECSQKVLQMMADCADECNNSVREHQDTLRMHQLHEMYKESGNELVNLVSRDHSLLKEGELIRHHRGKNSETHLIQLFSDQLITASKTIRNGLKLQRRFPLIENSNLCCLAIPPKSTGTLILKTWFVLIADDKTIFYEAKTPAEMMEWVSLINLQLTKNRAIRDVYNTHTQLSLVNNLMNEIRQRRGSRTGMKPLAETNAKPFVPINELFRASSHFREVHWIQTAWWHLLTILEEEMSDRKREGGEAGGGAGGDEQQVVLRFKRLIEKQCKETASQLMLTIVNKKSGGGGDGVTPIQSLLFNNSLHYFITTGIVFEYQPTCVVTGAELYDRPLLLKLFLLSDVLIGAYVESANEPYSYSFHILLQDLEISDEFPGDGGNGNGVGSGLMKNANGIILMDTSKPLKRRLSLSLFTTGNQDCAKRLIHAVSVEEKLEWMSLLYLTKKGYEQQKKYMNPSPLSLGSTQEHLSKLRSSSLNPLTSVPGIVWEPAA